MSAFVRSQRMAEAGVGGHYPDRLKLTAAVLAGILAFLAALVEDVSALVRPERMPCTGAGGKSPNTRELHTAVGAIILWHNVLVLSIGQKYVIRLQNLGSL